MPIWPPPLREAEQLLAWSSLGLPSLLIGAALCAWATSCRILEETPVSTLNTHEHHRYNLLRRRDKAYRQPHMASVNAELLANHMVKQSHRVDDPSGGGVCTRDGGTSEEEAYLPHAMARHHCDGRRNSRKDLLAGSSGRHGWAISMQDV